MIKRSREADARPRAKDSAILIGLAFVGWGLCGVIIAAGRATIGMKATLIVHAIAVPVVFGMLTWFYYRRFGRIRPLATSLIFLSLAMVLDAGVIAPFAEKSYAMFRNVLGTWIPFASIFVSTFLTGRFVRNRSRRSASLR